MEMASEAEIRDREGLSFLGCEVDGSSCRLDGDSLEGSDLIQPTPEDGTISFLTASTPIPSDFQSWALSTPHTVRQECGNAHI